MFIIISIALFGLSMFYAGRNNAIVLLLFSLICIIIKKYISTNEILVVFLLGIITVIHMLFFFCEGKGIETVINIFIIYIPCMIYFARRVLYSHINADVIVLYFVNLLINSVFILQIFLHGFTRERVDVLNASVNLLAASNLLFVCLYLFIYSQKKQITSLLFALLSVACTLITLSRVSIVVMIAIFISYGLFTTFSNKNFKKIMSKMIGVVIVSAFIAITSCFICIKLSQSNIAFKTAVDSFKYYFQNVNDIGLGSSRNYLWNNALINIKENFWLGNGSSLITSIHNEPLAAHNFILEILLLSGFFGIFVYFLVHLYILFNLTKNRSKDTVFFVLLSITVYLVNNLFQPFISTSFFYNVLFGWILITISYQSKG